ncbi:hypothetical protein BJ912DRAFT_131789 [Pholiota molesta]|nr:hypothetical protein BJ912DRAFT_131789 [Pholiota molesta]
MTSPHPCHVEGGLEGPSQDDPLPTNQNHTRPTENDLPTIHITSYGHRLGPLLPAPDLAFDLRALPNPPKSVRTGHTGLSKALRDAFFADERVQQRFQETCAAIRSPAEEAGASGVGALSVGCAASWANTGVWRSLRSWAAFALRAGMWSLDIGMFIAKTPVKKQVALVAAELTPIVITEC